MSEPMDDNGTGDANEAREPSSDYVQSLARGLNVIRAFDRDNAEMTLSDIARRTGLTRATSRRFLLTLAELGYVRTNGRLFALTARVLELGFSYLSSLSLPQIAQPHLEELAATTHESTSASVLEGSDIVYVARVPVRRIMSVQISIGTHFPAYATSMGRVLLAQLSPEELDAQLKQVDFAQFTSRTIRSRDDLIRELSAVQEQGWALVDQELEVGLRSIAAPIRAASGTVMAAINVSTSATARSLESIHEEFLPPLLLAAERISHDLTLSGSPSMRPLR